MNWMMAVHGQLHPTGKLLTVLSMTYSQLKKTLLTLHSQLLECFVKEPVFLETINALLGITGSSMEAEHKQAVHHVESYFIEDDRL